MADANNSRREQRSEYFIVDNRSNQAELARLQLQDQMLTAGMGGVWPEQSHPERFQRVLDVGCGTGAWLIEIAKTYPSALLLVGIDAHEYLLDYARIQAEAEQVSDRVEFRAMDAMGVLDFPSGYFDLVNLRFGMTWLRTWDWPRILQEFQRVTRQGGVIRITEPYAYPESTSLAHRHIGELLQRTLYQAGHLFTPEPSSVLNGIAPLLQRYGVGQVQTCTYVLEYRFGTPQWQSFFEDSKRLFPIFASLLRKWIRLPDNYEALCQQALADMQQPEYVATWRMITAWGIN